MTGQPLKSSELIKLSFAKNEEGEMVDPVTFKVFTDNTHIIALKNTGNVFAYDTVERLNIKAKMWRDLINDEEFSRKDIIVLQDPQNVEARNLSSFKYLQEGVSTLTEEQERERNDPGRNVNKEALGNAARILKAKEAVARARDQRDVSNPNRNPALVNSKSTTLASKDDSTSKSNLGPKSMPYNAAQHTTGKAAASFTSTGLTPHTSGERALLTDEEYMLKPRRVKQKGYARIHTSLGDLNIELLAEFAPRAVWNFVHLAKKGYYRDVIFHRNIRNFMLQGGDPTGTGKGGTSIWGKNFQDEFDGPLTHDARGVVSMANKGKNTNSSQFFITYRPAKHLDRKHTIFGKVVGGMDTLGRLENVPVSETEKRPLEDVLIKDIVVFVDPFEEFQKLKRKKDEEDLEREEVRRMGGTEDDRTTWTGKRLRGDDGKGSEMGQGKGQGEGNGVGKYLHLDLNRRNDQQSSSALHDRSGIGIGIGSEAQALEEWEEDGSFQEPAKKKSKGFGEVTKGGGFGNFESW